MIGLRIRFAFRNLVFLALIITLAAAIAPAPKCKPNLYYRTLPLIADEAAILNLDTIFSGYNLDFTLEGADEWKQYISMSEKMHLNKEEIPDTPMLGLKSHHLQRVGNSWGSAFIVLSYII